MRDNRDPNLPARRGGKPVRQSRLPFSRPSLGPAEEEAVLGALRSGRLVEGERVRACEEALAQFLGVPHVVMVSSAAAALHAALYAVGVSRGDEVIISPLAPAEVGSAVLYLGARPIFADVDPFTLTLDPEEVRRNLTPGTRALVVTHYAGLPAKLEELGALAAEKGLALIEDVTCALGATYQGHPVGSWGQLAVFSFSPEAVITTGTGGAVATRDLETYQWIKLFTSMGTVGSFDGWVHKEGPWHFEIQEIGFDYRANELQGALGEAQLRRLPELLDRRRKLAERYREALDGLPLQQLLVSPEACPSWCFYPVRLELEALEVGREEIYPALWAEGIEVGVHYYPMYQHPLYGWVGDPNVCTLGQAPPCPKAESIYPELLSLPLYPAMSESEQGEVIAALRKVLNYYRKGS
ncbi:DegT/DnrJ/EryC1/StrS family aminotransferase [Desulfothermobacter acidiphilus]|uniref:DegT/DnrJ/EryC1/StrS family aminotransferase n=1 Tax=Desulfothermobacter acidiphilus TaxID=1938353 RepID=UPI003F8B8680